MSAQPESRSEPEPRSAGTSAGHLDPEAVYELIEGRLPRRKRKSAEEHLADCPDCLETLALVLKADRPASVAEQATLARIPEPDVDELLASLAPRIESSPGARHADWRTIGLVALIGAVLLSGTLWLRSNVWLPATSRRVATETLDALVELRQATGRLPLRYIAEFERAGVVRSSFDEVDATEQALIANLRRAVERAPVPEAELTLGLLLLDDGQLDEAEARLTRVRERLPLSVDALNGLAVVYFEKARHADASDAYGYLQRGLALLRNAEQADPEDLRVLYNYGKFYEALEMPGAARRSWERYVQKDPVSQWGEEAASELNR